MANKIETSTAMLHHFVCCGTYESYLGEYIGGVARDERDVADDAIGKLAVEIIAEALWDTLPSDVNNEFECEYTSMYHPRYYNFETDSANFTFEYSDELKDWFFDYVTDNQMEFEKFLADNYTSRDGFLSFTPNNWNDWLDGWNDTDWRCVSALINFLLFAEGADYESYQYAFDEKATELIYEQFTPYEYAERYDNGFMCVVQGEYNDCNGTVYNAWLLDANGTIVNTMSIEDEYDENFHCSAYAAFEYGDIEWNITSGRMDTDMRCTGKRCDVPDVFAD